MRRLIRWMEKLLVKKSLGSTSFMRGIHLESRFTNTERIGSRSRGVCGRSGIAPRQLTSPNIVRGGSSKRAPKPLEFRLSQFISLR